jgi:hypothetical protein
VSATPRSADWCRKLIEGGAEERVAALRDARGVQRAAVAVVIASGTLTVLDRSIGNCAPFKVSKGQAFIEPPNHAHLARNEGTKPVTVYAMFLGIPKGAQANRAAARPTGCAS